MTRLSASITRPGGRHLIARGFHDGGGYAHQKDQAWLWGGKHPFHHPFHTANRFALLDHLTRGRVILGCGPGALAADAHMMGINTTTQRNRIVEGVKTIVRLFTEEGKITIDGSWFKLQDAHLQIKPYQKPHMPIYVASTISPSGMVAVGQLGCGVLSVASFAQGGLDDLKARWAIAEETAAENGKTVDRKNWRLVMPVHLAESRAEAMTMCAKAPTYGFRSTS